MAYWSSIDSEPEANLSGDYIREAIKELVETTSGRIKGTFSRIEYTEFSYHSAITALAKLFPGQYLPNLSPERERRPGLVEVPDEDLEGKQDINAGHKPEVYKFEIYNQCYRFRILRLINFSYTFPVGVLLDEGIAQELRMERSSREINSNADMQSFLHKILKTQKVRNVVNQLLILDKIERGSDILAFLQENPKSTAAEIAAALKWPRAMVKDTLELLEEDQKIEQAERIESGKSLRAWTVKNGIA